MLTDKQKDQLASIVAGRNPVMFHTVCQPAADNFCEIIRHLHEENKQLGDAIAFEHGVSDDCEDERAT